MIEQPVAEMDALAAQPAIRSLSVAADGTVWAVGIGGYVLQNTENRVAWTPSTATATWIVASAEASTLCAVVGEAPVSAGFDARSWSPMPKPDAGLRTIEVGFDDASETATIWATDEHDGVLRYEHSSQAWTPLHVTGEQLAATADGVLYRRDKGKLYRYVTSHKQPAWMPVHTVEDITKRQRRRLRMAVGGWNLRRRLPV